MKNVIGLLICLLASLGLFAQAAKDATLETAPSTLKERYLYMKSKAQSFKEYKVIKESVLDGVWKISQDSLRAKQAGIAQLKDSLKRVNGSLQQSNAAIKAKEESLAGVMHAGTHITVLGMDMLKSVFITIVVSIIIALALFVGLLIGRLKMVHVNLNDKTGSLDTTQREFEEYKRKAMEKQTKLSRELQDERNKMQGQRSS